MTQTAMGFMLPETDWELPSRVPDFSRHDTVAVDIETRDDGLLNSIGPGWVYGMGHISGVALAAGEERVYLPVRHPETQNLPEDEVRRAVERVLRSCRVVMHRAVYDLGWLSSAWGLPMPERLDDTMVMEFCLDENQLVYGLDAVCARRGVRGKDEAALVQAATAMGLDPKTEMWKLPARYVGSYAEQDAGATLELAARLRPMIAAQDVGEAYQLEIDLIPMIIEMRRRGIRIDQSALPTIRREMREKRDEALAEISRRLEIGRRVEISDVLSPRFMEKIFQAEGLPVPRTEKGNPSFKTEKIESLEHWLPSLVVQARKMQDAGEKFVGNYIEGFLHRGRIHAEIHPTKSESGGTRTTRLAYSDPPLQQMPSRVEWIKHRIRGAFLPEEGEVWGAHDYSQQEYRLIVHFAYLCRIDGALAAVERYRQDPNTDFHTYVAEITRLPRRRAKDCNFGKAFGAGIPKFAEMTGMSLEEAAAVMSQYDEELPFVKGLSDFCSRRADRRGFIRMIDGARSRYERWESAKWHKKEELLDAELRGQRLNPCSLEEAQARTRDPEHLWHGSRLKRAMTHKAMNSLIQGSAARQTKLAMRECWRAGLVPLIQMHDELSFSHAEEWQSRRVHEIMRDVVRLEVPVVVDSEHGPDWGHATSTDDYDASWAAARRMVGEHR